jgi:hypothetical protein
MEKVLNKYTRPTDTNITITDPKQLGDKEYTNIVLIYPALSTIKDVLKRTNSRIIMQVKRDFDFQAFNKLFKWQYMDIYSKKQQDYYFIVTQQKIDHEN